MGERCRVVLPAMKASPIIVLEANAGVLELGHFSRFQDPPLAWTFSKRSIVSARDLHMLSNSEKKKGKRAVERLTHKTTPTDDRHGR